MKSDFMNPFLAFTSEKINHRRSGREFTSAKNAFQQKKSKMPLMLHGKNLLHARQDIRKKGEETLAYMEEDRQPAALYLPVVHTIYDPEVNHGIPETDHLLRYLPF